MKVANFCINSASAGNISTTAFVSVEIFVRRSTGFVAIPNQGFLDIVLLTDLLDSARMPVGKSTRLPLLLVTIVYFTDFLPQMRSNYFLN